MTRRIVALLTLAVCLLYLSGLAIAGSMQSPVEGPITSPYGYRVHPIYGTTKYHSGVDIGTDYGDPIRAAASGVVTIAGWLQGYGYTVVLFHGNGLETLYGHNQELTVSVGQTVTKGQIIALSGSTGNSTGPHCHFEVLLNDVSQDPGLYVDGLGEEGSITTATDSDELDISLEISADFAKPVRDVIDKIVELCTDGLEAVKTPVAQIFMILLVMDFAVSAMYKALGSGDDRPFLQWLVYKVVFYGFLIFLLNNWGDVVGNFALYGLPYLGSLAVGSSMEGTGKILSDPTQIIQKGMEIITPVINEALHLHGSLSDSLIGAVMPGSTITAVLCLIFGTALFGCFLVIGFELAVAYINFYMTVLFSSVSFMFAGLKFTRKYASNGINGVIASSINLMFFCMFSLMLQNVMVQLSSDNLITTQSQDVQLSETTQIGSLEEALARIKSVESSGDYTIYNYEGSGAYGAYQQMPEFWDGRCQNYVNAGGTLCLASEDSPSNAPDTYYSWCAENQDKVSAYMLEGYYADYGSWDEAVRCWVGGPGLRHSTDADEYFQKLLNATGGVMITRVANIGLLFQLLLVCLMFIFMGDRMAKLINKQFGNGGFKLSEGE